MKKLWNEEEDQYILNNYNKMSWHEMATNLNCSFATVQNRARKLGIEVINKKVDRWTDEDIALLREYANKYVIKNIAKKLNKSELAVKKKAAKEKIILHSKKDIWKKWMVDYLKDNINKKSIRQIALFLGLNDYNVRCKIKELNLDFDPTIFKKIWTKEEEDILRKYASVCHYSEITKLLPDKSKSAILCKARDLNINIITDYIQLNDKTAKFIIK